MTLATRLRPRSGAVAPSARPRTRADLLFGAAVGVLLAVHLVIFGAVLVLAPETAAEQRALALLQLPVEVARACVLPFHALLLACLFVLGDRIAGRWAGFGAMLAVLALDLAADPANPVYGPPTAEGGWVAAALLAAAMVVLARRPLVAAALLGAGAGAAGVLALALPAFLVAVAVQSPQRSGRGAKARELAAFAGVWAAAAAVLQVVWLSRLGADAYLGRVGEYLAEFRPHALVPFLEQQRILFAAWHFPPLVTVCLALFLFVTAAIGLVRYLVVPWQEECGPLGRRIARRLPPEILGGVLLMVLGALWWSASGSTVVIDPNLPMLAAVAPLLTPMAYRGAKWLLTVNRFWALCATVYLVGLILARSTQLVLTLIHAVTL